MFALLEIAHIYKALKLFADLQGPIWEIFTKKRRQQQNFDSDPKEAWHLNYVTFTPIAKNFMLYCRLIYTLSMLYDRLTIKVKVGIPESFKVGWYPHKITGSSHLKSRQKGWNSCPVSAH